MSRADLTACGFSAAGPRGTHPRQQSVAATIDWSYHLLDEREKALFERLSVFAGGFDLEAVHGVCADAEQTEDDILDLLTGLVDKSMVFIRSGSMATRYGVLETLRGLWTGTIAGQGTCRRDRSPTRALLRRTR